VPDAGARALNDVLESLRSGQRSLRQLVDALETEGFDTPTVVLADVLSRSCAAEWTIAVRPEGARVTSGQASRLMELLGASADVFGRSGAGRFRVEIVAGPIICCELTTGAGPAPEPPDLASLHERARELGGTVEMTCDREGRSISVSFPRER
jgi:signal transduction histidine kinase